MLLRVALLILLIQAAAVAFSSPCLALNCAPLEPRGGANVDQVFQGKLSGRIDGLFARLAGGQANVEGIYREVRVDVLKEYPNSSKDFIWERLIYLQCELLNSSKANDGEKDAQFKVLVDKLTAGPPQDGTWINVPFQADRGAVLVRQGFSGASQL